MKNCNFIKDSQKLQTLDLSDNNLNIEDTFEVLNKLDSLKTLIIKNQKEDQNKISAKSANDQ